MKYNKAIFNFIGVSVLSLNFMACTGSQFLATSFDKEPDTVRFTLKSVLALNAEQRAVVLSDATTECLPVEPQPAPGELHDGITYEQWLKDNGDVPEELTYEQFLKDNGDVPEELTYEQFLKDNKISTNSQDSLSCVKICQISSGLGGVVAYKGALVPIDKLDLFSESDENTNVIGDCNGGEVIIPVPIQPIDTTPKEL